MQVIIKKKKGKRKMYIWKDACVCIYMCIDGSLITLQWNTNSETLNRIHYWENREVIKKLECPGKNLAHLTKEQKSDLH